MKRVQLSRIQPEEHGTATATGNRELEAKVKERTKAIMEQKEEIEAQDAAKRSEEAEKAKTAKEQGGEPATEQPAAPAGGDSPQG